MRGRDDFEVDGWLEKKPRLSESIEEVIRGTGEHMLVSLKFELNFLENGVNLGVLPLRGVLPLISLSANGSRGGGGERMHSCC